MTAVETAPKVVGTAVKRKEDASLLRGRGTYVENLTLPGTAYMVVVRSPYPRARITGALIAEEIVVRGNVQGSIRGNAVTFQSSSRVEGDVFHKSLAIEQGAFFEGKSRRSDDPMSVQRSANGMPPPGV